MITDPLSSSLSRGPKGLLCLPFDLHHMQQLVKLQPSSIHAIRTVGGENVSLHLRLV